MLIGSIYWRKVISLLVFAVEMDLAFLTFIFTKKLVFRISNYSLFLLLSLLPASLPREISSRLQKYLPVRIQEGCGSKAMSQTHRLGRGFL